MTRLRKFLRLPGADRRLLLKVTLLVWAVRVGLWLLPFRMVRQLLARLARKSAASLVRERVLVDQVVWAVTTASRYVPLATCLTQALVTKTLLGRYGHDAKVRIGVTRSEEGHFQAHAWVESNGTIVIGGSKSSLQQYALLGAANGEPW